MTTPPIDPSGAETAGSDTFARFRYQAKLTLLFWLGTFSERGPLSVYAEHIEDILLEYGDHWRLAQVKSRAPTAGPWTADELCADGEGVDSLCRAYAIAKDAPCTFELFLEGPVSKSAATSTFIKDCTKAPTGIRTKITAHLARALGGEVGATLDTFLSRLRILPNQPSQRDIDGKCIRTLARLAPSIPAGDLDSLYERLLLAAEAAQEARPAGLAPQADVHLFIEAALHDVLGAGPTSNDKEPNPKQLTRAQLQDLLPHPPGPRALLLLDRLLDSERPLTALEEKLAAAGAPDSVVLDARQLRAMAEVRRLELLAGPSAGADQLADLSHRVLIHARAVALQYKHSEEPATDIWTRLVTEHGLEDLDAFSLFFGDRQSIVGLLCCLSDECRFAWTAA
jgi:hypothetical protein